MKMLRKSLSGLVFGVLGLLASSTSGQGGFTKTCILRGAILADQKFLGSYCTNKKTEIYGYNWTWIDLDLCVTNEHGILKLGSNGRFSGSCAECSLDVNSTAGEFTCRCKDGQGHFHPNSTVELDKELWNRDGTLGCYDHKGNKTWAGPQCKTCGNGDWPKPL